VPWLKKIKAGLFPLPAGACSLVKNELGPVNLGLKQRFLLNALKLAAYGSKGMPVPTSMIVLEQWKIFHAN